MLPQKAAAASEKELKPQKVNRWLKLLSMCSMLLVLCIALCGSAQAETLDITIDTAGEGGTMDSLRLLFIFALIALAPSLLIMMTSFTRIVIVFSFLRNALGLQQTPPNQVLIGLALFLTFFIMHHGDERNGDRATVRRAHRAGGGFGACAASAQGVYAQADQDRRP